MHLFAFSCEIGRPVELREAEPADYTELAINGDESMHDILPPVGKTPTLLPNDQDVESLRARTPQRLVVSLL